MGTLGGTELIIVLVIVMVLFGASTIPKLAKSLGQAKREFEHGIKDADQKNKKLGGTSSMKSDSSIASSEKESKD